MFKKISLLFTSLALLLTTVGSAYAVTLKASHQWPGTPRAEGSFDVRHEMVQIIADEMKKANVGVDIRIYPAKSLYKPKEQWKPMTTGQLDISAFPLAYAAKFHPEFDITLMPGMVKNHKHALRVNASPMMKEIKKIINDAGVVVLSDAWLAGGFVSKKFRFYNFVCKYKLSLGHSRICNLIHEIRYKIESSLPQCKGTDYREWNECYGENKFPRIEYKGEWKNGTFHGKGILKESWGDIYIGDFVNNKAEGFGRQDIYNSQGEFVGYFEGELKIEIEKLKIEHNLK